MSPVLFAVYVNSLLEKLQNIGLGCHIGMLFMGAFMYADDLVLVSASISDLQSMIDVCFNELNSLDMKINAKKIFVYPLWKRLQNRLCSNVC